MALTAGRSAELISSNSEPLNILLIYSGNVFVPASTLQDQPMRATITAGAGRMVNFHLENLPDYNLSEIDYEREMAELIFNRHRLHPPDLIIAGGAAALNFLDRHRETLWPEKPAMFYSVLDSLVQNLKLPVNVTGRTITFDANGTIDLALQLHPATARLVVLTGANQAGWSWLPGIRAHLQAHYPTLATTYLTNQTVEEMSASLAALSPSDVVLYTGVAQDAAGRRCDSLEVLTQITKSAGAPVYGLGEHHFGHGIVGGVIPSFSEQGRQAGLLALQLLAGESPASIPVEPGSVAVPMVDWHQLKRWQIRESLLPAGTVIVDREPTFWEQNQGKVIGVLVVMGLQSAGIFWLLIERKRRRRVEARMVLATQAANLGVWEWDVIRDELWVADSIRSRVGLGKTERPNLDRFFQSLHPDDREAIRNAVHRSLEAGNELRAEYRSSGAAGEIRWLAIRGRVERGADGRPRHMRGVSVDITERKKSEAELHNLQGELAHVQRLSTMGHLSTALAHELNQPLGAILSNAEAAEMLLDTNPPSLDQVREILLDIRKDDERAGEVIRRMRSLLRRQEMQIGPLDVGDLIREVLRLVSADAALRKVKVGAELEAGPLPTRGDRVHLQQVLLNLIVNGLDAVAGNPPEARRVIVQAGRNRAGEIEISVRDNGPGIPAEQLPRLFEPFFTTKPNGMGMGTSIARSIVQAHHGRVWVAHPPDGGADFRVTLPIDGPSDSGQSFPGLTQEPPTPDPL